MVAAAQGWTADLLNFWFHQMKERQWFGTTPAIDRELRRRFAGNLATLSRRPAGAFLRDPLIARAAILLFDQVPRNIHRGAPGAFATDALARRIVRGFLRRRWDRGLDRAARQFVYMPLMHSEHIADQRASLRLFAGIGANQFAFARAHYRMIARFGRFPHRNDALGRHSTPAERRAVAQGNAW